MESMSQGLNSLYILKKKSNSKCFESTRKSKQILHAIGRSLNKQIFDQLKYVDFSATPEASVTRARRWSTRRYHGYSNSIKCDVWLNPNLRQF